MTVACVLDGVIQFPLRDDVTIADIPPHKREHFRPVEGEPPTFDPRIGVVSGPVYALDQNRVTRSWRLAERDLATVKAEFCAAIDNTAEEIRARYATPHAGMVMTYQEKFACANAVDQMGKEAANALSLNEATQKFAVLAASVGVEAETLWDCAQVVITKYNQWTMLANAIERTRLSAKKSINESASVEAALAAFEDAKWTV